MSSLKKINGKYCKMYELNSYSDKLGNSCTLWTNADRSLYYFSEWDGFEDILVKMVAQDLDEAYKEFVVKCYESGGRDIPVIENYWVSAFPIIFTDDDFSLFQEYGSNNYYIFNCNVSYKIPVNTYDSAMDYFLDAYYVELVKKYGELDHIPTLYTKEELKGYAHEEIV